MKISIQNLTCAILLVLLSSVVFAEEVVRTAIVLMISGGVTVRSAETEAEQPAKMFQKLGDNAQIKTAADGKTTIAFLSGKRFQVNPDSDVRIGKDELEIEVGSAKPLPVIPNSVSLAPIIMGSGTDETGATVRLRNVVADEYIEALYPRDGAGMRATAAILRFQPVEGSYEYEAAIETAGGEIVYRTTTASGEIPVPDGVLQPGSPYRWTVETKEEAEIFAWGGGSFHVLSTEREKMRNELREYALKAKDSTALTLLVGLDMNLGLWWEAREDLRIALEHTGENPELSGLQKQIDQLTHLPR